MMKTEYQLTVKHPDTGEQFNATLRHPDRATLSMAIARTAHDPLGAAEALLRACWINGDQQILDDDTLFLGAASAIDQLMTTAHAELKKK